MRSWSHVLFYSLVLAAVALLSGCDDEEAPPGVTSDEVVVGMHAILSGDAAVFGLIPGAIEAYFETVNAEGGVHGRHIRLEVCDSQFDPTEALRCAERLVEEEGVFTFLNNQSFAAHQAAYDYLDEQGVPDLLIASGAQALRDDLHERATPGVISYYEEARRMGGYLGEQFPGQKVGLIFLQDVDGVSYADGLEAGFDGDLVGSEGVPIIDQDMAARVDKLLSDGAEIIVLAVPPPQSGFAIRAAREDFDSDAQFVLSSVNLVPFVLLTAGEDAFVDGTLIPITIKEACLADDPAVQSHRGWAEDAGLDPSYFTIYGQVIAEIFVEILEEAGEDLTRDSLVEAARNVDDLQLDLAFGPIATNAGDVEPFESFQLMRVDGTTGCVVPVGDVQQIGSG